ncbi:hypothetical protein DMC64_42435 [Amycolatopsis sp. WAC 04197]|uniref:prenyltransferase/squalene oxidase repeat-containing protein n=1 Tax=Amycolatopsis sp. WAC 04197 TaxID=2203199 RepID=UPI000F7B0178|nr:prenyltransferase/squalene oxidase repeat-containing protein [Amycolatopsis sp. WAC 04197]RSN38416.1 hypothetical protein DMC64_42435 [Amycolatopsis sp. WAC 04197]
MNVGRLRTEVTTSQAKLLSTLDGGGRWHGGCRSRLFESALALHLFRRLDVRGAAPRKLAAYCRTALATPAPRWQGPLERDIARLIATSALGLPVTAEQADHVRSLLGGLDHHSRKRKHDFFLALLSELVPQVAWPAARAFDPGPHAHRWITLIATSLRLLTADDGDRGVLVARLTKAQGPDGSWQCHVPATVTALLALAGQDRNSPAVRSGLAFLVTQQRADGGLPFIADEDTWVTGLTTLTLLDSGLSPTRVEAAARYLADRQLPDGGWGYSETVDQADADDTAVITLALSRCPGHERAAERGARHLLALQNEDGGFPTFVRGAPSEVEITAKCLRTLAEFPGTASAISRGWRWLGARQGPDGGFTREWSRSPAFPVLHVLRAAADLPPGDSEPDVEAIRAGCARFLRETAAPGGGWRFHPHERDVSLLVTSHAVAALGVLPDPPKDLIDSAVPWLLEPGAAVTDPDSLGPRPFVYDVPILARVYRLAALAAAHQVLARRPGLSLEKA